MTTVRHMAQKSLGYLFKKAGMSSRFEVATSGYLRRMGWFESHRTGMPVDAEGAPLPWLTYAAIAFLEERVHSGMDVFEYSCGNSTLWWSSRVACVTSCEHDEQWYQRMKERISGKVTLHHIALEYGGAYSKKIAEYTGRFDIIVIDGRDRNNCAKNCLGGLKGNGVIIWDNSDRDEYRDGFDFLAANGFKRLDFSGMGPVNTVDWCTSVFYRTENCLGI